MEMLKYPTDEARVRKQLRLLENEPIPEVVFGEYELRLSLLHGDGATGPINNPYAIADMLRHLKLEPVRQDKKPTNSKPADWRDVPKETRVIVNHEGIGLVKGFFCGMRGNSIIAVRIPDENPELQSFMTKQVSLDIGQLDDLPKAAKKKDPAWDDVPLGTPLAVKGANGKIFNAALGAVGPRDNELTVIPEGADGEPIVVRRTAAAVHKEALASL